MKEDSLINVFINLQGILHKKATYCKLDFTASAIFQNPLTKRGACDKITAEAQMVREEKI
jgi:hypothetical protein